MPCIETANSSEARRARRIQFSGLATRFEIDGSIFIGRIVIVKEDGPRGVWSIQFTESNIVQRVAVKRSRSSNQCTNPRSSARIGKIRLAARR